MTEQSFRRLIERPHHRRMHGNQYLVHPALVGQKFGDGRTLLALSPIATAPEYYVVRIHSGWTIDNRKPGPCIHDHLDEILEAIEEEHGYVFEDDEEPLPWPALRAGGSSWGLIRWRDVLKVLP